MTTKLYLVRHAASAYTPEELNRPLSQKGLKDTEKVTELLKSESIDRVISSPYKRAIQTVEGTSKHFALPVLLDEGLRERNLAEGSVENFEEVILKYWEDFSYSLPGGECGYAAQKRGVQALRNILNNYPGENIVIGTHGNIMALTMNYYDKVYDYEFWSSLTMPDIYKLTFEEETLISVRRIW